VSVTDSTVVRPLVAAAGARVARVRALERLCPELALRRVGDPALDERPLERLFDARVVERDLDWLERPLGREDDWAMATLL
jgi:hypothetical protein